MLPRLCSALLLLSAAQGVDVLPPGTVIPAGEAVTATVTVPALPAGQSPVLRLRHRVDVPGGGGGNYVLGIEVNGRPLTETPFHSRLVNKPPFFDPPGTEFHFAWYSSTQGGWFSNFTGSYESDWAGTGQDCDSLLDLTRLMEPGQPTTWKFRHLMPTLPTLLKLDAAPLWFEAAVIAGLDTAEIKRLRAAALAGAGLRELTPTIDLPADAGPGTVEYQLAWTGRPAPPAQVRFDDLSGWRILTRGDAEISLSAARGPLLWRAQNAAFRYGGGTTATTVQLVPPEPIPLTGPFDAADLWLHGALKRGVDRPLRVSALLQDAAGVVLALDLGPVTSSYWGLQHGVLPIPAAELKLPVRFTGLLFDNCQASGPRTAYLESLTFYPRNRQPLTRFERPDPPVFPTSDRGLLPPPPAGGTLSAAALPDGAALISRSAAGLLRYEVRPAAGCLAGITARWNDGPTLRPFAGGGIAGPNERLLGGGVVDAAVAGDDVYRVRWSDGQARWETDYRLDGRTLVIDLRCPGGLADGLRCGRLQGATQVTTFGIPYLKLSREAIGPWFALADGLFIHALPDVYHSDFATIDGPREAPNEQGTPLLRGTSYATLTDGRRRDLRERLLLTVSPDLEDLLPSIPNPPSPNRERLAPYMFVMGSGFEPELWRTLKSYGLDHVIASDFARFYVNDYAEGFSLRWRPHPSLTLQQVQDWRGYLHGLGYLFGGYQDARDVYPLNEQFNPDWISLQPDGDLRDGWFGNFYTKPNAIPKTIAAVGRKVHELYPTDCVYLDVHTNLGPAASDYEAGVELAGTGRGTILGNGDGILEARQWYGSTISEGIFRWLYAGLCDLDYAQLHVPEQNQPPLLVDFDLRRIHPLQHGTMMGYGPVNHLSNEEINALMSTRGPAAPEPFYDWVSASLAYGHMLLLGYSFIPPLERTLQLYALMQGLQQEYLTDTVAAIDYHSNGQYAPVSEALRGGEIAAGQVRVRYTRGLTIWVNHHPTEAWEVTVRGRPLALPPFGWAADKPGEIFAFSALQDGARVDYVECPEYRYLNSPGGASEGGLTVIGAVWLKRTAEGWRLIPCGNLGAWKRETTPGLSTYHRDWILGEPPADRGCSEIVVATSLLPEGVVVSTERADGTRQVAATSWANGQTRLEPTGEGIAWRWPAR